MFSKISLKKVVSIFGVIVLLILLIVGCAGYRNNWNFNLFFDEQVIDLEGEMEIETLDGNLVLKPREMILYHYRLIMLVDYELNPDLDDLDLKLQYPPWLLIKQQDNTTSENSKPLLVEADLYSRARKNLAEDYFRYEYRYRDLSNGLDLEQDLTFYLYNAELTKRVQKEVPTTPGEKFTIDIPGIGTYKGELAEPERNDEGLDKINFKGETNSDQFEHGFTTQVNLISKVGEDETLSARRTYNNRNTLSDSTYQYEHKFEIEDDEFWDGELMISIGEINVPLGPRDGSELPHMDLKMIDQINY
ncbi:hypothetical protein [Natranaerobius thermophilus]|uniref:Lipoprotein n=1 Tax=Natranaerobius thermophilus (strain ATCC BAA-1301 / DSM 18059 / JW/NM-WN-LF) TaxID=457570 RepID=B2A1W1_NATTJ|nr:hypothetical protein [Natranaerobius thermophilus]ACB86158.1 hypothetical protein Nther_2602 [Natranaerobius thermophilus JW/NM-WN-LF]